jgi:DNA topoisomerase I
VARFRRADCSGPGLARRRRGRGFEYLDEEGERIEDDDVLARLRGLAIPPAWEDVWVCPDENGHLQATGTDSAGRKQYLYHPRWRERRDQQKFDDMLEFARRLPRVREAVAGHLARPALDRERVLACAVRLLDRGFFRVGGEDYAEENGSYGLATMLKRHVTLGGGSLTFDYPAKGGERRVQAVVDGDVHAVVTALKRRRGGGDELLAFQEGRAWRDVRSGDINAYLKEVTGADYSAKDFRTWNATVLAAVALAVAGEVADTKSGRKRAVTRAVKEVSFYLGNTPAVCRASYIDPRVFDAYDGGLIIRPALEKAADARPDELPIHHPAVEAAVLDLIGDRTSAPGVERIAA